MPSQYRQMRFEAVRESAMRRRYDPHIEAINRLVDELREEGQAQIPYVDACLGGVNSQVLFLFQDPGPGTDHTEHGCGFLSPQNDDPSAECFLQCLHDSGLDLNYVIAWNAYPWRFHPRVELRARHLTKGLEPLRP